MTTNLEKQFFDRFGIEPKTNQVYGIQLDYHIEEYPQITDRILLELICILNKSSILFCANSHKLCSIELDTLKEEILRGCILHTLVLKSEPEFVKLKIFKRDIQTLFKE